jgi:hypothetical protein
MEKVLQEYYENRFDMMASVGWKDLLEDLEKMIETYNNVSSIDTVENLYFKKGQLDILRWVASLKQTSEEVFEELQNAENI